jgi:hypothetical protein
MWEQVPKLRCHGFGFCRELSNQLNNLVVGHAGGRLRGRTKGTEGLPSGSHIVDHS